MLNRRHQAGVIVALCFACGTSAQTHWIGRSLHPNGALESKGNASTRGIQGGTYVLSDSVSTPMPAIWRGNADSVEILDPSAFGWRGGQIKGAFGVRQVGYVYQINASQHAVAWSGTAGSLVDLHPTAGSYAGSEAEFVYENQVVGNASKGAYFHAALWNLATGDFTDLHPAGTTNSWAGTTDGVRQGGAAYITSLGMGRALIWNSSPDDYIDITPNGSTGASIRSMTADTQVGFADFGSRTYAALWHNSADTYVNLSPPEVYYSQAIATTGTIHVGWARILTVGDHACAWISDSPDGFIDLHPFLGPGYSASSARAVSVDGNIVTVVGTAMSNMGRQEAVMWTATIPAPGVLGLSVLPGLVAMRRRRSDRAFAAAAVGGGGGVHAAGVGGDDELEG